MNEPLEIQHNRLAKKPAPREGPSPWYRRPNPSPLGTQDGPNRGDPTDDMSTSSALVAKWQAFVKRRHIRRMTVE